MKWTIMSNRFKTQINVTIIIILYIAFVVINSTSNYNKEKRDLQERCMTISKIAAEAVDIGEYNKLVNTKEKNEYYNKMTVYFDKLRKYSDVKYVYVEKYVSDTQIEYILDADGGDVGKLDTNDDTEAFKAKAPIILTTNTKMWGSLMTAFTPIKDTNGNIIGLVGVDYDLTIASKKLDYILYNTLISAAVLLLAVLVLVFTLSKSEENNKQNIFNFYGNAVGSLFISLSKKSEYTGKHSERVAEISLLLAQKFYKDKKLLETIRWAALLHDIGKIAIPGEILNKPGRLTEEEFDIIKTHPQHSKDILNTIFGYGTNTYNDEDYEIVSDIALYHHERWDGEGYPCKLKGEQIPFKACLVSLADAYEAMTAERPYKKPMTKPEAAKIIMDASGKQFAPEAVTAFIECMLEGKL